MIAHKRRRRWKQELSRQRAENDGRLTSLGGAWPNIKEGPNQKKEVQRVNKAELSRLLSPKRNCQKIFSTSQIKKLLDVRRAWPSERNRWNWSAAESLASQASRPKDIACRLSGQDSARGTFSQRHAVLHDYPTDDLLPAPVSFSKATPSRFIQSTFRNGRARLRVRIQPRLSPGPNRVGSAVRRFLEFCQVIVDQFIAARKINGAASGVVCCC